MNNKYYLLEQHLLSVVAESDNLERYSVAAKKAAAEMDFNIAKDLFRYYKKNINDPQHLQTKLKEYGILGEWKDICQNAILEILYYYKEKAIPLLYKIGFGEHHWTQSKAIVVLCRLASEGVETDKIVENIGRELPWFSYENQFPSFEVLATIKGCQKVVDIFKLSFDEYIKYDPVDAFYILKSMAINYPDEARKELIFLRNIIFNKKYVKPTPVLDESILPGSLRKKRFFSFLTKKKKGRFAEEDRVNAALLYHYLSPGDADVISKLKYWETNAKNGVSREAIKRETQW